ncbi:MAG: hypothetical protein ED557_10150 [Balneola sp.]|nr:MAG: hypothetical protein ED557_10150 [Balneola sp.]
MFHVKHSISHIIYSVEDLKSTETIIQSNNEVLGKYTERLLWWNEKINLVSRDVSHETLMSHVHHSLLLYPLIERLSPKKVIDTGTGGGLPGLPLAVCMPAITFHFNDIVQKKIMAVKQMSKTLGLDNTSFGAGSIANEKMDIGELVITKHAFKISDLVGFLEGKPWAEILFLKGEEEVGGELSKTSLPLKAEVISLDKVITDEFYQGKAIVRVKRMAEAHE